jgi:precorrin-3B synthase
MAAGDGLLLRVRPALGQVTPVQLRLLGEVASRYGNGAIDLTGRAGLQLRGVSAEGCVAARQALIAGGLVDPDPARDARSLQIAPGWQVGDDTHRIATELYERLDELPPLPGKIGIAIDAGAARALADSPADFRVERGAAGGLILRAEGRALGVQLPPGGEVSALIALARWFVDSGGIAAGRMARHAAALPGWVTGLLEPAPVAPPPSLGAHALGCTIGLPFGRIEAVALSAMADLAGLTGVRMTPWRRLVLEGVAPGVAGLPDADPRLLAVDACVGAPACPQASVATRPLARRLATMVAGGLHVSGCAKGCARQRPADIVLTGRDGRFDLARHARAGDPPVATGLSPGQLLALFGSSPRAA